MSMSHSHTSQHWTHLRQCEFIAMTGDEVVRHGRPEEKNGWTCTAGEN